MIRAFVILIGCLFFQVLFPVSLKAQNPIFSKAFIGGRMGDVNTCLSLPNGEWLLAGEGAACNEYPDFFKLNAQGDTVWSKLSYDFTRITDLYYRDNKTYVIGWSGCACLLKRQLECYGCSFGGGLGIRSIDGNGVWDTTGILLYWSRTDSNYYDMPTHVLALNDSNVLLSYADSLYSLNPMRINTYAQWNFNWREVLPYGFINAMGLYGTKVFLATDSGVVKLNSLGHIQATNTHHQHVSGIYTSPNGNIYALTRDLLLLRFDSMLHVVDSLDLSTRYSQAKQIKGNKGNLSLLVESSTHLYATAIFDTALTFINDVLLANQCAMPVCFDMGDSLIFVAGNDSTLMPNLLSFPSLPARELASSMYAATYGLRGEHDSTMANAVLSNAIIDSVNHDYGFPAVTINYAIFLTNTGTDTIHSVGIATDVWVGYEHCFQGPDAATYTGLNLATGDSIKLDGLEFYYPLDSGQPMPLLQHFYLMSLNGNRVGGGCTIDSIASPIYLYNGIETLPNGGVSVYPNPANSQITIQLGNTPMPNTTFTLTDLSGRQLLSQSLTNTTNQVDICQLAAGVYVYTIKDGLQVPMVGKVVKQ